MKLNGLVLSPILPQQSGQGNRARVYDISKGLSEFANLHLLYYLYETINETEYTFERFDSIRNIFKLILPVVPTVEIQPPPKNRVYHQVDEWWDSALEGTLKYLSTNFKYDFVVVNYVWLSKAFEYFPNSVIKILDAHDVFTGRENVYSKMDVKPEFFYTNIENESIGINRSDLVIGIQDLDTQFFKKITKNYCLTLPHIGKAIDIPNEVNAQKRNVIVIGLLGVANKININSFRKFINLFESKNKNGFYKILVAGSVCEHLNDTKSVEKVGYVEKLVDFFSEIDVFINPVEDSTGQKIKLADAIAYEIPFFSTKNGSEGLPVVHEFHKIATIAELVDKFFNVNLNEELRSRLKKSTIELKKEIEEIRERSFKKIHTSILTQRKLTVIYFSSQNNFFNRDLCFERALALRSSLLGSSIVKILVSDSDSDLTSLYPNVVNVSNFLLENENVVIDTLFNIGDGINELEHISRRIVYDVLSIVNSYGNYSINPNVYYAYNKKITGNNKHIRIPLDLKFNYSKLNKKNSYKVFIVSGNYEDTIPRVLKRIFQMQSSCEIILPHNIKNFKSIERYAGLIEVAVGFIFLDSTDPRFDILKEIVQAAKIPCFYVDKYLNSMPIKISSSSFFNLLCKIPSLLKSGSINRTAVENSRDIWSKSPSLWNFIRS